MDNEPMSTAEFVAAGGAKCELCGERMLKADGCTYRYVICKGSTYDRIPFGEEQDYLGEVDESADAERCHDCGALQGHYHHFNCDVEECPVCGGQLIGCDCEIEYTK